MAIEFKHVPIMLDQCLSYLEINPSGTYVDCTAGGGGHSEGILNKLTDGRLICIDRDTEALDACRKRFASNANSHLVSYVHSNYKQLPMVLANEGIDNVDGIMVDLGVSSYQLDNRSRGFSYLEPNATLDMRMDTTQGITAVDVVNNYSQEELANIIFKYGEDKFSRNIARNIVQARETAPITTCGQLVEIIDKSIPAKFKFAGGHCAKRTFQALRIEVNQELTDLFECVCDMVKCLKVGGNIVVLTFHSLEDRIVKQAFVECAKDCICPPSSPICICDHRAIGKILTRKPVVASNDEQQQNSRSASCKLRALTRI